jgi:hypothetical protein
MERWRLRGTIRWNREWTPLDANQDDLIRGERSCRMPNLAVRRSSIRPRFLNGIGGRGVVVPERRW